MKNPLISVVKEYVKSNIDEFHQKKIDKIKKIKLKNILKRKNPYLFKAKNVLSANDIIKGFLDAHISSNEETIFGDWLEKFAIFVCYEVYNGMKSSTQGIDLEFENSGKRYIVSLKSGPNWGNSSQIREMISNFKTAKKTLRTSGSCIDVTAVNGCCYGKDSSPDKGDYFKYCGQDFWKFISGNDSLYKEIIEPLGYKAKEKNEEFKKEYAKILNLFVAEFIQDYCFKDGSIDWAKLVEFNSGRN